MFGVFCKPSVHAHARVYVRTAGGTADVPIRLTPVAVDIVPPSFELPCAPSASAVIGMLWVRAQGSERRTQIRLRAPVHPTGGLSRFSPRR